LNQLPEHVINTKTLSLSPTLHLILLRFTANYCTTRCIKKSTTNRKLRKLTASPKHPNKSRYCRACCTICCSSNLQQSKKRWVLAIRKKVSTRTRPYFESSKKQVS